MYEIKYFRKYLRSKVSCQLISENSRQGLHTIVQYIVYLCTKVYYRNRIVRHQSCYLRSLRYNQISLAKSTKFVCVYGINRKKRTFVRAHAPSLRGLIWIFVTMVSITQSLPSQSFAILGGREDGFPTPKEPFYLSSIRIWIHTVL
jgi:hypothetical protein